MISSNAPPRGVHAPWETVEHTRCVFLSALEQVCPTNHAALLDLTVLFGAPLGEPDPAPEGELGRARAACLASLRAVLPDQDARVRDLARFFAPLVGVHRARREAG